MGFLVIRPNLRFYRFLLKRMDSWADPTVRLPEQVQARRLASRARGARAVVSATLAAWRYVKRLHDQQPAETPLRRSFSLSTTTSPTRPPPKPSACFLVSTTLVE